MGEKLTPNGLVVGLIVEPDPPEKEEPKAETPIEDKPKRGRQPKAE